VKERIGRFGLGEKGLFEKIDHCIQTLELAKDVGNCHHLASWCRLEMR
jgi:hypothetical protein